jgi:hypothetical protein
MENLAKEKELARRARIKNELAPAVLNSLKEAEEMAADAPKIRKELLAKRAIAVDTGDHPQIKDIDEELTVLASLPAIIERAKARILQSVNKKTVELETAIDQIEQNVVSRGLIC